MPIISTIGRRAFKVRLLIGFIYTTLAIGAISMVYPFLLMIAGSTKSAVDTPESKIIPEFIYNDAALYKKHIEGFYNESLQMLHIAQNVDTPSFRKAIPPVSTNSKVVKEWKTFLSNTDLPLYIFGCSYIQAPISRGVSPYTLRLFRNEINKEYNNDISKMNAAMGTEFNGWPSFYILPENYLQRRNTSLPPKLQTRYNKFKEKLPIESRIYFSVDNYFKNAYLKTQYPGAIDFYNKEHNTYYNSWNEIHLTQMIPGNKSHTELEKTDWINFIRSIVNLRWIRATENATPEYHKFLIAKYKTIEALNRNYKTSYTSFTKIKIIKEPPESGLSLSDWNLFVQGWKDPITGKIYILPEKDIQIYSVDFLFRDYLIKKYKTLDKINQTLGLACKTILDITPPQRDMVAINFEKNKTAIRKEFITRNYICVVDYLVLHGRAIINTVIYCFLAILSALTINPIAAYALSRYKPPSAYKVLLFLMLTMAFPPMVTQIPNFLMLRELGLLNTFAALILPGMANGYSVFLLKGFFDSLPQELYESAELDGAGELRIFWQITMSLSKPILAVIALQAFNIAYSNFMMALLICQDKKMWTLMPWLYQLQQGSGQGVIFASLIISAIPTFVIFVLCQNIIMRGIVVPVEK